MNLATDFVTAAIAQAEQAISEHHQRDPREVEFLEETAATRPSPDQPGTLGEQLHAVNLFLHLPAELRGGADREVAWQSVLNHVLPHRRPLGEQVDTYFGRARQRATDPTGQAPRVERPKIEVNVVRGQ